MTPSRQYKHLSVPFPKEVSSGLDGIVDHAYGFCKRRWTVKRHLYATAKGVARKCKRLKRLSDDALKEKLYEEKVIFRRKKNTGPRDYEKAIAYVGIAAERTLGMHPYPVQYMGALTLLDGKLAEMATGEGKTLAVAIAAVLMGWTGNPVHLLTANDYLAERDAEAMKPLFDFCGLSVGYVIGEMQTQDRKENYARDLTYTTSKELLADFLRDRLASPGVHHPTRLLARDLLSPPSSEVVTRVLRGIHTAIVDEADGVLIDDATTPLIISQKYQNDAFNECCKIAFDMAADLKPGEHYHIDYKQRDIHLTTFGYDTIEENAQALPRMWRSLERSEELVKLSLIAREFFKKNKDYVIVEDKIVIVDPNTGRQKTDSTWRGGIHQAIEVKENVPVSDNAKTLASLTFQGFFRLFDKLGATTGTASSASKEFWHIYRLPVIRIPTNRRCKRRHYRTEYVSTLEEKWERITQIVLQKHREGRPVLIGTGSVEASAQLAQHLNQANLPYQLLNAIEHKSEAEIIAKAGKKYAITIATNMAGRGTDIKLEEGVAAIGGLHVIGTDLMESKRIDRQLYGRAARQGDPGSAQTIVSTEDELLKKAYSEVLLKQCANVLKIKAFGSGIMAAQLAQSAQKSIERKSKRQRYAIIKADKWLKESLAFTGGLHA